MKLLLSFLLLLNVSMMSAKPQAVLYSLGMSKPSTHFYEVEVSISNLSKSEATIDFLLPVWRTGRYMILDFASGIQEFSAINEAGASLVWNKQDKATWRVELKGASSVTVTYKVYANEFNLRTRGLNDEHGFVDGTAVFMYVEKYRQLPIVLQVKPFGDWHVTTGLENVESNPNEFHIPNYDILADCPLEIGNQKDFPFDVDGTQHILTFAGDGNWNTDTLIRDISKIVRTTRDLWGSFPYKKYIFLFHCNPQAGGGTEHLNSAVMGVRPFSFKNPDSYRSILGLISHEYFHTWNVKQVRPKGIHPYDYTKENYSEELWVAEGTTSYYGDIVMIRSGFQTPQNYIDGLATSAAEERRRPGNKIQPLAEASFDAWVKYWRGNQQSYNNESDYYGKGETVSLMLDLEIRKLSAGTSSLDDVLRAMYKRFPLSGKGYTTKDVKQIAEEYSGSSLDDFFANYVYGTEPLPWESSLLIAGLELTLKDTIAKPWIGMAVSENNTRAIVNQVVSGSPAYNAGVDIGDELVALNGFRIRAGDFVDRIKELNIGDIVTLTVLHNDRLKTVQVTLQAGSLLSYKVAKVKTPTDLQKSIFEHWLSTKWDEPKK